jgi:hypothetical protein
MRNYAKEEVAAMQWPDTIDDPEGDLRREIDSLRRCVFFWRSVAAVFFSALVSGLVALLWSQLNIFKG